MPWGVSGRPRKYVGEFEEVVGALDGAHIPIPGPSIYKEYYINHKELPSMQLYSFNHEHSERFWSSEV